MTDRAISMTSASSQDLTQTESGVLILGTADFVWEFSIKIPTTNTLNNAELVESQSGSDGNYQISLLASGTNSINWQCWNNGATFVACLTSTSINDGACHTVTVKRVGDSLKAWIDGVLEGDVNTVGTANLNSTHTLFIGNGNGGRPTSLQVSSAKLWKTTIPSEAEIETATATSIMTTTATPILDTPFEDDADDDSGNGFNWTVNGGAGYVDGCIVAVTFIPQIINS